MYDEKKLIEQLQSGQKEAFSLLYDTHFQTIYNHIYYKTLNQALSEDIISDTFFKAFDKIHQFVYKNENSFRSRLYTIANNTLLDSYKKTTPDSLDEGLDYASKQNVTGEENTRYIGEQVLQELEHLSGNKKDVIIMRLREGLSYEEIAEITWRNETSLRKDFSIAMKELKIICAELGTLLVFVVLLI